MASKAFSPIENFFISIGNFIDERLVLYNEAKLRRQRMELERKKEKLLEEIIHRKEKARQARLKLLRHRKEELNRKKEKERKRARKIVAKRLETIEGNQKKAEKLRKKRREAREKKQEEKLRQRAWRRFRYSLRKVVLSIFVWFHFVKIRSLIKQHEKHKRFVEQQEREALRWAKRRRNLKRKQR